MSNESTAGARLQDWLCRAGLTQQAFADELGVTQGQVSNLMAGRRTPSLDLAAAIERRTGIPASSWVSASEGASA